MVGGTIGCHDWLPPPARGTMNGADNLGIPVAPAEIAVHEAEHLFFAGLGVLLQAGATVVRIMPGVQ